MQRKIAFIVVICLQVVQCQRGHPWVSCFLLFAQLDRLLDACLGNGHYSVVQRLREGELGLEMVSICLGAMLMPGAMPAAAAGRRRIDWYCGLV